MHIYFPSFSGHNLYHGHRRYWCNIMHLTISYIRNLMYLQLFCNAVKLCDCIPYVEVGMKIFNAQMLSRQKWTYFTYSSKQQRLFGFSFFSSRFFDRSVLCVSCFFAGELSFLSRGRTGIFSDGNASGLSLFRTASGSITLANNWIWNK